MNNIFTSKKWCLTFHPHIKERHLLLISSQHTPGGNSPTHTSHVSFWNKEVVLCLNKWGILHSHAIWEDYYILTTWHLTISILILWVRLWLRHPPIFKRFSFNIMEHVDRSSPDFGFAAGFSILPSCWEPMVRWKGRKRNARSLKSTNFPTCFLASHKESPLEQRFTIVRQMTTVHLTMSHFSFVRSIHTLREHFLSQYAWYWSLNIYLEIVCRVKPWLSLRVKYSPFLNN